MLWLGIFPISALFACLIVHAAGETSHQMPLSGVAPKPLTVGVNVIDDQGHQVTLGLTEADFSLSVDGMPQRIEALELPVHQAPTSILVIDFQGLSLHDQGPFRSRVIGLLNDLNNHAANTTEILEVSDDSLQMLQPLTRVRSKLLRAARQISLPVLHAPSFTPTAADRIRWTMEALQQIALLSRGVQGRKDIIWIGENLQSLKLTPTGPAKEAWSRLMQMTQVTTNMLNDSQLSILVIEAESQDQGFMADHQTTVPPRATDPLFETLARLTDGALLNDVETAASNAHKEIQRESNEYLLKFQPPSAGDNDPYQHLQITMRNPGLHAMAPAVSFALQPATLLPKLDLAAIQIGQLLLSPFPLARQPGLPVALTWHGNGRSGDLTTTIRTKPDWQPAPNEKFAADVLVASEFLDKQGRIVGWWLGLIPIQTRHPDAGASDTPVDAQIVIPQDCHVLHVLAVNENGDLIGSAELKRKQFKSPLDWTRQIPLDLPSMR